MFNLKFPVSAFILIVFCQTPCFSQTYKQDSAIIKELTIQMTRYKKAFLEDDVETAIAMTHPEMVDKMGGVERMHGSFKKGKEMREAYKMQYTNLDFTSPDSILVSAKSYQAAFPVVITTKYDDGSTFDDHRVMIAFGDIALSKWYFLAIPPKEIEKLKATLRFVDAKLVIPE